MTPAPPGLDRLKREIARTRLRAIHGIKVVAAAQPARVGMTPKDLVWSRGKVCLWRYRGDVRHGTPIVLFLGLLSRPYVFDLHPGNSLVERLLAQGFDVFLIDWGVPDAAEGDHGLETYVDFYLPRALEAARRAADVSEVTLFAYCMGAMLAMLLLGSRHDAPVRNLVLMTPLCDFAHAMPAVDAIRRGRLNPDEFIDETTGTVPADVVSAFFRLRKPTADLVQYVTLWEHLWQEDYVNGYRAMARWVWDHVPIPGPAFRQVCDFVRENPFMTGSARVAGRPVHLEAITMPTLILTAERDEMVPPLCSAPLAGLLGASDLEQVRVPAGHVGVVMGRTGARITMPALLDWLERHSTVEVTA
jgi:polyhydroxyalkanoate synthase